MSRYTLTVTCLHCELELDAVTQGTTDGRSLPDGWEWMRVDAVDRHGVVHHHTILAGGKAVAKLAQFSAHAQGTPFADEIADMVCRWFAQIGDKQ